MTKRFQFKLVIFANRPVGIATRLLVVVLMQTIAVQYTWSCVVGRFDDSVFFFRWFGKSGAISTLLHQLRLTSVKLNNPDNQWRSLLEKTKICLLPCYQPRLTSVNLSNLTKLLQIRHICDFSPSVFKSLASSHLPLLVDFRHVCRNLVKPAVLAMFVKQASGRLKLINKSIKGQGHSPAFYKVPKHAFPVPCCFLKPSSRFHKIQRLRYFIVRRLQLRGVSSYESSHFTEVSLFLGYSFLWSAISE